MAKDIAVLLNNAATARDVLTVGTSCHRRSGLLAEEDGSSMSRSPGVEAD
jgi:hypothetical protein